MRPQDTKVTTGPFFWWENAKKLRLKAMESPIFGVISISVTGLVLLAIVFGWNHGVTHHNCGGFLEVFREMVSAGTMGQIWYWLIFGGGWTKSTSWCENILYIYIHIYIYLLLLLSLSLFTILYPQITKSVYIIFSIYCSCFKCRGRYWKILFGGC